MDIIIKYFPKLTPGQTLQISLLEQLYAKWNEQINVISRKDFGSLYEKHVLHSLSIAKFIRFLPGTKILDVGTGGGFPGIPLAILFPEVQFHLIDSIGKKIKVVNGIIESLGLKNTTAEQKRAEQLSGQYDFVVSRAVTRLPEFVPWVKKNISPKQKNVIPNGILYLKGGDIQSEIRPFIKNIFVQNISDYFNEEFFKTKKIIHMVI